MKLKYYYLLIIPILIIVSCGKEEIVERSKVGVVDTYNMEMTNIITKNVESKHEYTGDSFRDPFISLSDLGVVSKVSEEVQIPNLASLSLKGIFIDAKSRIALLSSGGMGYLLKGSALYDNRQRLIKGFKGRIEYDKVIITGSDNAIKELKLREK